MNNLDKDLDRLIDKLIANRLKKRQKFLLHALLSAKPPRKKRATPKKAATK